jgi:hypothetical protein
VQASSSDGGNSKRLRRQSTKTAGVSAQHVVGRAESIHHSREGERTGRAGVDKALGAEPWQK